VLQAALRTFITGLSLSLYVLILGPPIVLWTMVTGRAGLLYAAGGLGVRLGLALAGIRVRQTGLEHLQPRGAVYACNHHSNVDAPAVFLTLRRLYPHLSVLYKAELRRLPVLVWVFDAAGFIPVERSNKEQSWPAIDRAAQAIRLGVSFFIFPEGTRSRTGELLPFKKGGFVMALKAQAPIVPVAVRGGRNAMRKGSVLIWPATVTVSFLPPVWTAGLTIDDRDVVIARVREAIGSQLEAAVPDASGIRHQSR
jgi:1-acyl-sn-glycerol-3-phosphate acyltransferase